MLWSRLGSIPMHAPLGGLAKRATDVVLASVALALLAPILLITASLLRSVFGRGIIVAQDQIGFGGKAFRSYKFRTVTANGDNALNAHSAAGQAARQWRETRGVVGDPTIAICLGSVLRQSGLDRLPLLANVLRGDMSFVGPRPLTSEELQRNPRCGCEYFMACPGLTGLWRLRRPNGLNRSSGIALDRYYARRWSLGLDLIILLKSLAAGLSFDVTA